MTREMQQTIKRRKQEAADLVRFANPRSKSKPTAEQIKDILLPHIPYSYSEGKPVITEFSIKSFSTNHMVGYADYLVKLETGKMWMISAYDHKTGRTPKQRAEDKTADWPSGYFVIFHDEVK